MHIKKYALASTMAASIAFVACTDANYDLSDIDTLARFNITDLKIPINVDEMILDSLLDIKEDSKIKRMKNGSYAVVVEDEIKESKEVGFDPISVDKPSVDPIKSTIDKNDIEKHAPEGMKVSADQEVISFDIPNKPTTINFSSKTVDNAVRGLDAVDIQEGTGNLTITISFDNVSGVSSFDMEGLVLHMPKGVVASSDGATYNPETNTLTFPNKIASNNGLKHDINLKVTKINHSDKVEFIAGMPKGDEDAKGELKVSDDIYVKSGRIRVYGKNLRDFNGTDAPASNVNEALASDNVKYETNVNFLSNLIVNIFHGDLYYNIEGINVNAVDLTDMPDALKETGTEIGIESPQLYLYINNPILQKYSETWIETDPYAVLKMTPCVENKKSETILPDDEGKIKFGKDENYIVCAPNPEGLTYKSEFDSTYDFTNINNRVKFTKLSEMLKGKVDGTVRVPDSLAIDIDDPKFDSKVKNFHLIGKGDPNGYKKVSGRYAFYAPIKMTKDSKIVYSDTIDIDTDDLDKVNIYKLRLESALSTTAPASSARITVYPIEDRFTGAAKDAREKALTKVIDISGDAHGNINNSPFSLSFEPGEAEPIKGLKGLVIKVNVIASGNDDLKPSQTIKISQIKAVATGAYEEN